MNYKYGEFSSEQLNQLIMDIHKKIHRLLFLKESNSDCLYDCIMDLIYEVSGLSSLFNDSKEFVELIVLLENIKLEVLNCDFEFKRYRKFVLDAHGLVDKLKFGDFYAIGKNV